MRRLRQIDVALLVLLAPVWLICITLHVTRLSEDQIGWMPILIEPVAGEAPIFREWLAGTEPAPKPQVGDRLPEVGGIDLRDVGRFGFAVTAWSQVDLTTMHFDLTVESSTGTETVRVPIDRVPAPWRTLPMLVFGGIAGTLLLVRGGGTSYNRAFFITAMAHGWMWATCFGVTPWQTALSLTAALAASCVFFLALVLSLEWFPPEVAPRNPLARYAPAGFLLLGPATSSWLLGWPWSSDFGLRFVFLLNVVLALTVIGLLVRNYRISGRPARRQLKWVILGFYAALFPVAIAGIIGAFEPSLTWVYEIAAASAVAIPIGIFIAIMRDDFLDIDRLLSETAAYSLASVGVFAVLLQAVPAAANVLSEQAQLNQRAAQMLILIALVALGFPLRNTIRPFIDRIFFRERVALEEGLADLRTRLATVKSPDQLFHLLGEELPRLLRCESFVVYGRIGDSLGPVTAIGALVPPAFEEDSTLALALADHDGPVSGETWRRWCENEVLGAGSRGLLESVAPDLIVPLQSADGGLAGMILVGPKRSGERFAGREIAWLSAASERAARRLERFEAEQVADQSQALRARLARYVPGAIQSSLESGKDLPPKEQEVTILFVDIRGYTSFSEGRGAEEIFDTVSRYTELVSKLVIARGGSVVEFHGDGLMVVFGAPEELPDKETQAVAAARDIVRAVPELAVEGVRLGVGVGIATGPAFVGNIQSADRLIWGAIGNTTNLAARLQGQTRDLDAEIAIDKRTLDRAGSEAASFKDRGLLPIRGRSQAIRVFASGDA